MKRARPDQGEIRLHRTCRLPILDPPEQVFVCRIGFHNDRDGRILRVIDKQIYRVPPSRRVFHGQSAFFRLGQEGLEILDNVSTQLDQPAVETVQIGEFRHRRINQGTAGPVGDLAAELRGALLGALVVWTLWSATELLTSQLPPEWAVRATFLRIFLIGLGLQIVLQRYSKGLLPETLPKVDPSEFTPPPGRAQEKAPPAE